MLLAIACAAAASPLIAVLIAYTYGMVPFWIFVIAMIIIGLWLEPWIRSISPPPPSDPVYHCLDPEILPPLTSTEQRFVTQQRRYSRLANQPGDIFRVESDRARNDSHRVPAARRSKTDGSR